MVRYAIAMMHLFVDGVAVDQRLYTWKSVCQIEVLREILASGEHLSRDTRA